MAAEPPRSGRAKTHVESSGSVGFQTQSVEQLMAQQIEVNTMMQMQMMRELFNESGEAYHGAFEGFGANGGNAGLDPATREGGDELARGQPVGSGTAVRGGRGGCAGLQRFEDLWMGNAPPSYRYDHRKVNTAMSNARNTALRSWVRQRRRLETREEFVRACEHALRVRAETHERSKLISQRLELERRGLRRRREIESRFEQNPSYDTLAVSPRHAGTPVEHDARPQTFQTQQIGVDYYGSCYPKPSFPFGHQLRSRSHGPSPSHADVSPPRIVPPSSPQRYFDVGLPHSPEVSPMSQLRPDNSPSPEDDAADRAPIAWVINFNEADAKPSRRNTKTQPRSLVTAGSET
eukprot:TRINITY_DN56435_c0_g1_i1.p1 TRINITY_DN56435_c0_g1~~TRINITY_DN56435_c0_g1_i1.p1  ORF type:complete len:399 (+),score=63.42 TRINITY_DN56435_c0_g1_i1:152-1198(+)